MPPKQKYKELKRLNIHIAAELHNAFKSVTAAHGTEMTTVLIEFITQYVANNLPSAFPTKRGRK
jgi:hypothetical protein